MDYSTITQSDVANLVGVSRGLVSLALADSHRVADQTKRRILAAAQELGYSRNLRAAELAGNKSTIVGIVLPTMHNPVYASLVDSIQANANNSGHISLVATAANDPVIEESLLSQFQELRVSGVICLSPSSPPDRLDQFAKRMPLCVIGTDPAGATIDVAHSDERTAAKLVIKHALERGYNQVAFVTLSSAIEPAIGIRRTACLNAAKEAKIPAQCYVLKRDTGDAIAYITANSGTQRTLIVTHNDLIALDAFSALRGTGVIPGEQFGLVGYDNTSLVQRAEFDITSIDQRPDLLGAAAMNLICERTKNLLRPAAEVVISPSLAVRSSS